MNTDFHANQDNQEQRANKQVLRVLRLSLPELAEYLNQEADLNPFLVKMDPPATDRVMTVLQDDDAVPNHDPWGDDEWPNADEWVPTAHQPSLPIQPPDLTAHLMAQCREMDEQDQPALAYMIHNLDENGYLRISKVEIANALSIPRTTVDRQLRQLQTFDPVGVGARSLRECLLLQLRRRGRIPELLQNLVIEDLATLALHHYREVARKHRVPVEQIREHARLIRSLEPKPGRAFAKQMVSQVLPDVEVQATGAGYRVMVRQECLPIVMVSENARHMLRIWPQEKQYALRAYQVAVNVVRSLAQREVLLQTIMETIVQKQRGFFDQGVHALKPLTLKMLSQETGIHESTLSRVIGGKYVETLHGIVPMKFFFMRGLEGDESHASRSIQARIAELIAQETPRKPLSDQKIADILMQEGVEISRRTVAKYRDELNIPSSQGRRV